MLRTIPNTGPSAKLCNVRPGTKIHIQVLTGAGANVLRLGERADALDNPEPFAGASGMQFTSTDGVVEIIWQAAEVWAAGLSTNTSSLVINFDSGNYR